MCIRDRTYILVALALFSLIAYAITKDCASALIHLGAYDYHLPRALFENVPLAWLGFPSPTFASGDYYPLIPYSFIFFAGVFLGFASKQFVYRHRDLLNRCSLPLLTRLGRHALIVYLLHQPILLLVIAALCQAN